MSGWTPCECKNLPCECTKYNELLAKNGETLQKWLRKMSEKKKGWEKYGRAVISAKKNYGNRHVLNVKYQVVVVAELGVEENNVEDHTKIGAGTGGEGRGEKRKNEEGVV